MLGEAGLRGQCVAGDIGADGLSMADGAQGGGGGGTLEPSIIQDGTQRDMRIAEWPSRHKEAGPGQTGLRASPVLEIESSQVTLLGVLPAFQWVPAGCHPNAHAWPHVDPPANPQAFCLSLSHPCAGAGHLSS